MKSKIGNLVVATSMAFTLLSAGGAIAAPIKSSTSLPLDGDDLVQAKTYYQTDAAMLEFATFIKSLDVLADHENPSAVNKMNDRSIRKKYYIAPFFQVREEGGVVGAQEIAAEGLKILLATMDLTDSFDLNLVRVTQLNRAIDDKKRDYRRRTRR